MMSDLRKLGWANMPLEVCEHEFKIFECKECDISGYDRKVISARSYAAGIGGPFVLVASAYRAGWDAGLVDTSAEIERLKKQNEILKAACEFYGDKGFCGKRARQALKDAEGV